MHDYSEISATTYYDRFGTWKDAMAAVFDPRKPNAKIPETNPTKAIERLAADLDRPPGAREMEEEGD